MLGRRDFLKCSAASVAASGTAIHPALSLAARLNGGHPLAPRATHYPPKAKQLLYIFLTGGVSHLDTFEYKPKLTADGGKIVDAEFPRWRIALELVPQMYKFKPCGESGLMVSELFPYLGTVMDEVCVIRSMHTDIVEHFQATLAMHTGSATVPMPSFGAWISYGLGTANANLPSFVVLAKSTPYAASQVWDCNFLPPQHQGVRISSSDNPVPNLQSASRSVKLQQLEQIMLRDVNRLHAESRPGDLNLPARTMSFDIAQGMMQEAPEVFDFSHESAHTLEMYGIPADDKKSFGSHCLMARRFLERGVRVVELIHRGSGAGHNWDSHGNMAYHRERANNADQPLAALITDMRQRGMLEDTVVALCTEFGRTPWANDRNSPLGRNHWHRAFTCLLLGAGVKKGIAYGKTDEYGAEVIADPVHVHDYHATILHLMGLDHKRLTYHYGGRDFRLTDVAGRVVHEILT